MIQKNRYNKNQKDFYFIFNVHERMNIIIKPKMFQEK